MYEHYEPDLFTNPDKLAAMTEAIDAAWQSTDPDAVALRSQLFPDGKPMVAEFIARISDYAREGISKV